MGFLVNHYVDKHMIKIIYVIVTLIIFGGCETSPKTEKETLNTQEESVLKVLIKADIHSWLDHEESIIADNNILELPITVKSGDYADAYKADRSAADQKFKDKQIIITGKVKYVVKTSSENNIIVLNGGKDLFLYPHTQMSDLHNSYVDHVDENDSVALLCISGESTDYVIKLSGCEPISGFPAISGWIDKVQNDVIAIVNSNEDHDAKLDYFVETAKKVTLKLPNHSECFKADGDKDKCIDDINHAMK